MEMCRKLYLGVNHEYINCGKGASKGIEIRSFFLSCTAEQGGISFMLLWVCKEPWSEA